jgi:uncharacterized membrane protein
MKILLINDNPVVSRLLALCTRDQDIILDEVKHVDGVKADDYDLLFVNDDSKKDHVNTLLEKKVFRKKVFISYKEDRLDGFDVTIKKPFLPSQIIEIIESIDMSEEIQKPQEEALFNPSESLEEIYSEEELPPIFPLEPKESQKSDDTFETVEEERYPEILDSNEIEKIKALLDMDEEIVEAEPVSDDEYEARKVKVIKEQLIAEGLEIMEEHAILEELSTIDASKKKSKQKQKETIFTKKELSRIQDAMAVALEKMKPKKRKKLLKGKKVEIKIKLEDEQ